MMRRTPVVLASSGGKDSVLALAALRSGSEWDVRGMLVTLTCQVVSSPRCPTLMADTQGLA